MVELLPTSNQEVGATLSGVSPEKKYEVQHEFARNRQSEGMDIMMKALIEESTKERKLPGPIGMGAMGIAEEGVVGIARPAIVLGSLGMSVTAKNDVQSNQRDVPGNDKKKRKRRFAKDERHIPIALAFCPPPSLSSLK